jgi:endonuclease/exonuclease/phosphatase family metal-dependent hydrolase
MRLASYNVENLFQRAKALNQDTWATGRPILEKFGAFNALLQKARYSKADQNKIVQYLIEFGLEKSDEGEFVLLRQNRGRLITRRQNGDLDVVASGRADWFGWLELKREVINERAMLNTGRVIRDVNADVIAVIEAEDRIVLQRFSENLLEAVQGRPYAHVMLIDGNDDRGIDVGLLCRDGFEIQQVTSHIDDRDADGRIFSRDCPEYLILTPTGNRLWVLVNHLKSKGFGAQSASNARRERQAKRIRKIADGLLDRGETFVAIVGDLNDTPQSSPLEPLLGQGSRFRDASTHPKFRVDESRPGTFGNCTANNKIDYLLLSPALFAQVADGEVFKKGVWGGTNGDFWEVYPEMERAIHAASDHAAIWVDITV